MAIDIGSFSIGAFIGPVLLEISKAVFKRLSDKKQTKRKLIRDDLDSMEIQILSLVQDAVKYYGASPDDSREVSRHLKYGLQTFAMSWQRTDLQLRALNLPSLGNLPLVKFRQALTCELDTAHPQRISAADPFLMKIHSASEEVRNAISHAKYSAA